ncbi:ABC transporter ATP-binding protein [Woodsholea maritima]|uniref:ABC transporter ATP-binding protein n=1 Tax=Woodsholea maritima TaxID=240237 RepID=UPI00036FD3F6|nr:ABC transporter ATP-binding protein [Woodsholea maritima]
MSVDVLSIQNASVRYSQDRPAVDGVSLKLQRGAVTALLGPSGGGKSTLLRAIAGLEYLDTGTISFCDQVWSDETTHLPPERRKVGVVFQNYALFPHLNALDNVMFGLAHLKGAPRKAAAMKELEIVELAHRAHAFPHELSGGEQQRVALARALAPQPHIVLLDEPFSGLDRRLRGELRETTAKALRASEAASLIVTHDADEAMALADEIALMEHGQLIQMGCADELYLKPNSVTAARLLGDVDVYETIARNGFADTPFGTLDAPTGLANGPVKVLIRPEGLQIAPASDEKSLSVSVVERRTANGFAKLMVRLEDGRKVQARVALTETIKAGDAIRLRLDPRYAHIVAPD